MPTEQKVEKLCKLCGEDCSERKRVKDPKGSYYCRTCYENAIRRIKAKQAAQQPAVGEETERVEALNSHEGEDDEE